MALSRARSLDGLQLVRPIDFNSVRVSRDILTFAASYNDEKVIASELSIGEAVREFEISGDFDGAAMTLFDMSAEEAENGNIDYALDLFNRAMSYVADDACLFEREWKNFSKKLKRHPITAPRRSDKTTSNKGSKITDKMST